MLSAHATPFQPVFTTSTAEDDDYVTAQAAAELEAVDAFVDELANLSLLEEAEAKAHGWVLSANAAPFQPTFVDAQDAAELEAVDAFVDELAILSFLEEQEEVAQMNSNDA